MPSTTYFDMRTIASPRGGACPVRGCKATLQPFSSGKARPLHCPDHQITIHQKTFAYSNPLRNILFEPAYFQRGIRRNPHKAETHRLGHENSEDALTWNVFARLARADRLTALASSLAQLELKATPELYLWGLPIDLESHEVPRPFPQLVAARNQFERGISKMLTEPDIMLHVPGQCLIVIEAKFTSCNTVADDHDTDVSGEKPRSRAGIISRYSVGQIAPAPLTTDHVAAPFFSQLYRNLVFAVWMARTLNVEWRLVNLVSELHHREQPDPTPFIHSLLPFAYQKRFVRYEWEQLFREHVKGQADLNELADYLFHKSANCEQGLAV